MFEFLWGTKNTQWIQNANPSPNGVLQVYVFLFVFLKLQQVSQNRPQNRKLDKSQMKVTWDKGNSFLRKHQRLKAPSCSDVGSCRLQENFAKSGCPLSEFARIDKQNYYKIL